MFVQLTKKLLWCISVLLAAQIPLFAQTSVPITKKVETASLYLDLQNGMTRSNGRLGGIKIPGSYSTEFYLSPGLQYAADPRFVIEGSLQIPVFHNSGSLALRTNYNLLLGVKYLF